MRILECRLYWFANRTSRVSNNNKYQIELVIGNTCVLTRWSKRYRLISIDYDLRSFPCRSPSPSLNLQLFMTNLWYTFQFKFIAVYALRGYKAVKSAANRVLSAVRIMPDSLWHDCEFATWRGCRLYLLNVVLPVLFQ